MENKQIIENQHFVPQFYLRNFVNKNGELHIFDVIRHKPTTPRGPGGVCADSFFYAAETGVQDELSQGVEEYFSTDVETPFSVELPKIIKKIENCEQIPDDDKYSLALFMNTMWLRGPVMRKMINDMEEKLYKEINMRRFSYDSIDEELENIAKKEGVSLTKEDIEKFKQMMKKGEYNLKFSNLSHLRFMLDSEHLRGFSNMFFGKEWIIHISKCERQFITSDNPVTEIFPKRKFFYGPTFLERTHIFPLTPTIAIEAIYPRKKTGKKIKRKTYHSGNEKLIDEINLKIAGHAHNYIYASRETEIDWMEEYIQKIEKLTEDYLKSFFKRQD